LGLSLLVVGSGGAYELPSQVWFQRGYRARGFKWNLQLESV